jgi:hypothetical protein
MSFDAYVVAFGLARLLGELHVVETAAAYLVLVAVSVVDTWLLYRFFSRSAPDRTFTDKSSFQVSPIGSQFRPE